MVSKVPEPKSENVHGPRVGVVIASLGRPENVDALLSVLQKQSLTPSLIVLSMETEADCPDLTGFETPIEKIFGPRGMTVQRNRGLDAVQGKADVVVFYDDDFVPSKFSIEGVSRVFAENPDIVGATGQVLEDGITNAGIDPTDARAKVDAFDAAGTLPDRLKLKDCDDLYGCNMAYRLTSVGSRRFDEDLPLYGWLEDVDFSAGLRGRLVWTDAFSGVHCGEKRGREKSGIKLGYSQIANPVYLYQKGTLPFGKAVREIGRTALKNHIMVFRPEPWIDRKGRVRGNWTAVKDMFLRKISPKRILDFH